MQRAMELDQMAARPFASLLVHFDEDIDSFGVVKVPSKNKKYDFNVSLLTIVI